MSTATKPQPVGSAWKVPEVNVGDLVHWYPDDSLGQKPFAAIVNSVGIRSSVGLSIVHPQSYNLMIRDGVRHRQDPLVKADDLAENGFWEHTPMTQMLHDLMGKKE